MAAKGRKPADCRGPVPGQSPVTERDASGSPEANPQPVEGGHPHLVASPMSIQPAFRPACAHERREVVVRGEGAGIRGSARRARSTRRGFRPQRGAIHRRSPSQELRHERHGLEDRCGRRGRRRGRIVKPARCCVGASGALTRSQRRRAGTNESPVRSPEHEDRRRAHRGDEPAACQRRGRGWRGVDVKDRPGDGAAR